MTQENPQNPIQKAHLEGVEMLNKLTFRKQDGGSIVTLI